MDPAHVLVLSGVVDVPDDVIKEVLDSVKILGRAKIIDRRSDLTSKTDFILVQTLVDVTKYPLPDQVGVPGEVGPWPVHIIPPISEEQDFQAKLLSFLQHEGRSMSDIKGLLNPSSMEVNTALISAISSLVDKCNATPADMQSYRKLRMFSGVRPVPGGEEEYDAWAEQTTHMLEEWQCSDSIKKQRIVESLRGPAADIVRFLRAQNPQATSNEYMQALETAFGSTETSSDLLVKFRQTFQSEGEKLSSYLLRLDRLLHCIFRKGGLQLADMNRLRIEQVARGALPHDMIAMRIRMTHKLRPPPSFNDLLKDIREEEDMLQGRIDVKNVVMSKSVTSVSKPAPESKSDPEVERLKREMDELKAEMSNLRVATVSSVAAKPEVRVPMLDDDTRGKYKRSTIQQKFKNRPDQPGIFCYRCGEDGHYMKECDGVENLQRVNKRLIKLTRRLGNYQGTQ